MIIMEGSDFEGTSPKLFWPETFVYLLPGAQLNQMLTLVVAIKLETPCEPELLLFAGMNDHLNAAENLGSNPDVVHRNERGGRICGFSIWIKVKSGI